MPRQLRVFLCHASQDKPAVRKMYAYLKQHGVQPWLDREDLLPGQDWEVEIPKAIFTSDVILVCLSPNSVNKEGYVQKEIVFALDKAMEKPQGTIFIIPVKLEECSVPSRLSRYQWVDYYRPDGRKRLLMGLNVRTNGLGDEVSPVILEDTRRTKPITKSGAEGERNEAEITEREAAARWAREKEEREAVEKAARGKAEHEKVEREATARLAREKEERDAAEKAERDRLEKQKLKPKEPALKPAPVLEEKPKSAASPPIKTNLRSLGIGGIIFAFLLLVIFGGNYLFKNFSPASTDLPATVTKSKTLTPDSTKSVTPVLPIFTPTPEPSETPSPTPTLGIGSTMISEKDGMVMIYVPAGEFAMGSDTGDSDEKPVHQVFLDAFWIDRTEVTNAMYANCVQDGDCTPPSSVKSITRDSYYGNSEFDDYPVIYVDWYKAKSYCAWARRELPTEAQWEKAARGTDGRRYPWGNDSPKSNLLNFWTDVGDTTEVGKYPGGASIYGALDMAGNVSEWVSDWYEKTYYQNSPSSNPSGPDSGLSRVNRGGSWLDGDNLINSTNRGGFPPTYDITPTTGFRCSLSP